MPDFDANEDLSGLPGSGEGRPVDPGETPAGFGPRIRQYPYGHASSRPRRSPRRLRAPLLGRHRRSARLACPVVNQHLLIGAPVRRRRRMWAECRRRPPGHRS